MGAIGEGVGLAAMGIGVAAAGGAAIGATSSHLAERGDAGMMTTFGVGIGAVMAGGGALAATANVLDLLPMVPDSMPNLGVRTLAGGLALAAGVGAAYGAYRGMHALLD